MIKKLVIAVAGSVALFAASAGAQTNPIPQIQFYQSALSYFTTFNPNLPVQPSSVFFWAGADTVDNQTMAASLGIEFLPFQSSTNSFAQALSFENVMRNTTVAGVLLSDQAGIGYNYTIVDTRLTGYIDVGRRFDTDQWYVSPGVRLKKMLTVNTFAGTGLELPCYFGHGNGQSSGEHSLTLSVFTGFKF